MLEVHAEVCEIPDDNGNYRWLVVASGIEGSWKHEHYFPTEERAKKFIKRIKEMIGDKKGYIRSTRISSSRYWEDYNPM